MTTELQTANSCGSCTVCCLALDIKEFGKPAGSLCLHCTSTGCGIYETRYQSCRSFFCGWRLVSILDDSWRPDRSGVLILLMEDKQMPEKHRAAGHGVQFIILGGPKAILRPGFAEFVTSLVARNVAVFMAANSPATLINEDLAPLVMLRDRAAIVRMLLQIYQKHVEYRTAKGLKPLPWVTLP